MGWFLAKWTDVRSRVVENCRCLSLISTLCQLSYVVWSQGWLAHEQIGNSHRYYPIVDADEYRDKSVRA